MPKRYRQTKLKRYAKKPKKNTAVIKSVKTIMKRELNKQIETKHAITQLSDGAALTHNSFTVLNSALLYTTQGTSDPSSSDQSCRIGDKITLKGVRIRSMFETNERFPCVTMRVMVIRSARGDTPSGGTIFMNESANKLLCSLNRERFSILYQRTFKMYMPNAGAANATASSTDVGGVDPAGLFIPTGNADEPGAKMPGSKLITIWIPGRYFAKNGTITYVNGTSDPKFFDYHYCVYTYATYFSGVTIPYNVGVHNDTVIKKYYKDA